MTEPSLDRLGAAPWPPIESSGPARSVKSRVRGIVVGGEAEAVTGLQPAVVGLTAVGAFADGDVLLRGVHGGAGDWVFTVF